MEKGKKKYDVLMRLASKNDVEIIGTVRTCTSDKSFLIGTGCNGTCVYLGIDHNENPVAVKRILIETEDRLQSVYKEIQLLDLLKSKRSKHIVSYRQFMLGKPFSYIIIDLCEESLTDFFKRNSKNYLENKGPEIIRETLSGLLALHSGKEILHMDLKPENIIVDSHGHMRLAEFGISKILGNNQTS